MSLRKRKFSNTNVARSNGNKSRSGTSSTSSIVSPLPSNAPPANPDHYQSFVLSVVDQSALQVTEVVEQRPPPTAFATVLQTTNVATDDTKSSSGQSNNPIPLPPPLPDENLKAAGILAELITLRGTHIASDVVKGRKSESGKFSERVAHAAGNQPFVLERFPNKFTANSTTTSSGANVHSPVGLFSTNKGGNVEKKSSSSQNNSQDDSRFLLNSLENSTYPGNEKCEEKTDDVERSEFVQELLLSMLSADLATLNPHPSNIQQSSNTERATPINCPVLSVPVKDRRRAPLNSESDVVRKASSTQTTKPKENPSNRGGGKKKEGRPVMRDTNSSVTHGSNRNSSPRPPTGYRHMTNELSPHARHQVANIDDEKDDDKPSSPRHQSSALRLNEFVYSPSAVRAGYGRDDLVDSGTVGRNVL